jgi:nucleoside-diphosphate-sugar epimerase
MKVAITGSAGFIGSNLVDACLDLGWDVIGIDNFSTGFLEMAYPSRFLKSLGKYRFYDLDINDTIQLSNVLSDREVVFHFAALPRVSFSIDSPMEADHANIHGTLSVLEASRQAGVRRVVFSGSSSVYGGVAEFPTPESALPSPKSPYALHKQAGAEYCRLYSELHGLDTVVLLYFNVFGKYQRANSAYATVIPAFFEAAMEGKSCRVDGDGGQSRDFCHVDNVVYANILASINDNKFVGDRFNIACGKHYSVNKVWETISKLLSIPLKKHNVEPRLGDPRKSHADISKATKILGYNSRVEFEEGMKLTSQWWLKGCPTRWDTKFEL